MWLKAIITKAKGKEQVLYLWQDQVLKAPKTTMIFLPDIWWLAFLVKQFAKLIQIH